MSVRLGLITVTCTLPASTFLEASGVAAAMAGWETASSVRVRTSPETRLAWYNRTTFTDADYVYSTKTQLYMEVNKQIFCHHVFDFLHMA